MGSELVRGVPRISWFANLFGVGSLSSRRGFFRDSGVPCGMPIAQLRQVSGPLQRAGNALRRWPTRRGLLLTLTDAEGRAAQGEASPLPGYSSDTLEECEAALGALDWSRVEPLDPNRDLVSQLERQSDLLPPACPAARCALETALLDLCGQQHGMPAWRLLSASDEVAPLAVAALVDAFQPERLLDSAMALVDQGFDTLKLKVGLEDSDDQLELLGELRARVGSLVRLRFDANQIWTFKRAVRQLELLSRFEPEFVEEPCEELWTLPGSPVPLAVDESLQELGSLESVADASRRCNVRVLVLKPMTLGLVRALRIAQEASRLGLHVIVSHTFDGPVGLSSAAALGLALGSREYASGLAPHAGLPVWPAVELPFGATQIQPWERPGLGLPDCSP